MKKRPLQDVVAPSERPRRTPRQYRNPPEDELKDIVRPPRGGSRLNLWIIAGISILILGFALSLLFSGARVEVTPRQQEIFVSSNFVAFKDSLPGELAFVVMTLEQEGSQTVEATGEERVEERASGTIVVYNDYSQAVQRLVKNTRFEAPDGRIYRIQDSIDVPGQKTVDGETVPGSIEVVVYADEPGESYNAELMDFTIPGFQGAPQYDHFYARSKTPMTSGFVGTRATVDGAVEESAQRDIRAELRESILTRARSERPDGFYLFDGAISVIFEELPQEKGSNTNMVTLREKATLNGLLFEEENFANYIAGNTIAGFSQEERVRFLDVSTLEVSAAPETGESQWKAESIPITVEGTSNMVWVFDEEKLISDLEGKSKDALPTILSGYPGIQSIEASLWPFWRGSFPEDGEKIRIEEVLE